MAPSRGDAPSTTDRIRGELSGKCAIAHQMRNGQHDKVLFSRSSGSFFGILLQPGWKLREAGSRGWFKWTTPSGRSYFSGPTQYPA